MTIPQILEEAANLVEKGWTQGSYVRDKNGRAVTAESPSATCWCILGAVYRVAWERDHDAEPAVSKIYDVVPGLVSYWNDSPRRRQSTVVKKLRLAASKARQKEEL